MINLRDMSPSALRAHEVLTDQLERPTRKTRSRWGDPQPNWKLQEWEQTSGARILHPSTVSLENPHFGGNPQMSPAYVTVSAQSARAPQSLPSSTVKQPLATPSSSASRSSRLTPSIPPSQAVMSEMATMARKQQQAFHNDPLDRANLGVRGTDQDIQPQTVWSPNKMTPKRTTSNMQSITPTGAAASAITRRQDGINESALHLRSRSQSPNQLLLQQQNAFRASPSFTSRDLAELNRRRDSDMSYTPVSTRLTPASSRSNLRGAGTDSGDLRQSTEKLNRIAALRSKLHQSSENLRKSSENLGSPSISGNEKEPTRTRSISSLKGGHALEAYGTFDADQHQNVSSLTHSRLLARSAGNVSILGGDKDETPASRLQNTIDMLKKTSNTDLTQCSLYEEPGSPCGEKLRRRGAVQKRVERYHPRHRAARNQTSEESDSNGSDASPLNQSLSRRLVPSNNRSVSAVNTSYRIGSEPSDGRRLFDQPRSTTTPSFLSSSPRRTTNYLAQKMAGEDMVGPDLGSDDSPRSSLNSYEWNALLEEGAGCQQLVRHVQDCYEQLQVHVDKAVQARMLVEESLMTSDQKRVMMTHIEKMIQKMLEKLIPGTRSPSSVEDTNGNSYTPIKNPQTCGAVKTSQLH
ncbi:hypothetical protein KIN20_037439 [Parelaphostrongylus tenuis]|uniref:Uncharacterized protein n=1 Tax=Parelaphostrongylus tenuis TaxID=148309 RepID=A0AAD5WLB1_PARTN|nr:hypothetical protein KIN20_037439 [Parelaphostrongylus tenuis]